MLHHQQITLSALSLLALSVVGCSQDGARQSPPEREAVAPVPRLPPVGRTIPELVRDLASDPQEGHGDYTPAGDELVAIGEPALEPVLPLVLSPYSDERACAVRVLCEITARQYGWRKVPDWSTSPQHEDWLRFWNSLGPLQPDEPYKKRWESVQLWRTWLEWKRLRRGG